MPKLAEELLHLFSDSQIALIQRRRVSDWRSGLWIEDAAQ
jgi:hypothetical protein